MTNVAAFRLIDRISCYHRGLGSCRVLCRFWA
jgi:hypothetical protein